MNGDGYDDILIGAKDADATAANNAGESYVVFGGEYGVKGWTDTNSSLNLDTLDGDNGFRLDGISSGDQSGISVSSAGDVNGDGLDDILIGATGNDAGESYIIFGEALMGSVSHETLTGDSNANTMVGGLGNDILLGQGGADVLYGGSGNDILTVTDNTFFKLKGGSGIDTLKLADGLDLDLTTIANNKVQGIEKIDMRSEERRVGKECRL